MEPLNMIKDLLGEREGGTYPCLRPAARLRFNGFFAVAGAEWQAIR
jgi:hypothetical protein